jgi:hypothetical protein
MLDELDDNANADHAMPYVVASFACMPRDANASPLDDAALV